MLVRSLLDKTLAVSGRMRTCCRGLGSAAILVSLAGCAVGPVYHKPPPPTITRYVTAETPPAQGAQPFEYGQTATGDWWRMFQSTRLNRLVTQALARNPSLQAAQASVREAHATLGAAMGIF